MKGEHRVPARGRFTVKLMKLKFSGCSLVGRRGGWFANRKHFYASISGELKEEVS